MSVCQSLILSVLSLQQRLFVTRRHISYSTVLSIHDTSRVGLSDFVLGDFDLSTFMKHLLKKLF